MAELTFTERVVKVIKRIPKGRVATYGLVAAMAGNPRAARQVVRTLNTQSEKHDLPWHRVINSKGTISLPKGRGFELQRSMLEDEGVEITKAGAVDLDRYLWKPRKR